MRRHEHRWMRYSFRRLMLVAVLGTGGVAVGQGQVVGWGLNQDGQARPISTGLFPLERLAAGHENVLAIHEDGSIRCWGNNEFGQTSIPPDILPVVEAAIGDRHVVVRQANGAVRAWGRNADGQCNVPTDLDAAVSIAAGSRHSLALGQHGGIRAWGSNGLGQAAVPQGVGSALAIAAGYRHSIAIRVDGSVVCWGDHADGQCSVPAGLPAAVSAAGGAAHTLVLLASGEVRGWGQNQYGQINVPAGLGPVEKVVAGELHSVVKLTDGAVRCWGFSGNGQISPPADLGPIRDVVAAWRFTAAITSAGTYRYWGWPDWLAMPPVDRSDIVEVEGGNLHSLARLSDGSIRAWGGSTYYGQTAVPTDLGPSIQIAAGQNHSVALLANGTVRCWGYWHDGATAVPTDLGPVTRVAAGFSHTMAIRSDGTVRCWGSNSHGQRDVPQDLETAIDISGGAYHSIALRSDGTVRVWGDSGQGQQNVPAGLQEVVNVRAGAHHGVALRSDGTVRCWGSNWVGECNVPPGLAGVVQIAAGSRHSIALRSDGTVVCWGAGTTIGASPHFGQSMVPPNLGRVTAIGRGHFNSFAILSPEASSCANSGGAGTATVSVGGGSWQNVNNWSWSDGGGPQVPGALTDVDLGEYGSIGSLCSAQAGTFTARSGSTLIVPFDGTDPDPEDRSIQVLSTANLAGRILLMASGVSTLPADLDIPVLSTPDPRGSFDIIQTNVPPPPGKFLTLVPAPSLKGGGTVFRLQLRDIRRDTLVDPDDGIGSLGMVVAVESVDIDADGFDDLALAIDNGPLLDGSVQILLNDGTGRMGSLVVLEAVPPEPTSLSVGDADGDGRDDVVVGVAGDSTARLFLNDGEGGLLPSTVFPIDGVPHSVNLFPAEGPSLTGGAGRVLVGVSGGVMPGNGDRVMFFPSTGGPAQQVVMLAQSGPGAGQAVTPIVLVRRGRIVSTGGTVTANVDGVKGQGLQGGPDSGGMVAILEPDAAGTYAVTRFVPIPGVPVLMDMGDIDGDGHPEIVSANRDPVFEGGGVPLPVLTMIRGGADGFGDAIPIAPTGASAGLDVTLVDPDDDGDLDIVSVHRTVGRDSEARLILVDVEEPGGPVSIGAQRSLEMDQPQFSVRGEFDAGGGEDFLLVEEGEAASLVEGTGPTRTFLGILPACPGDVDGSGGVGPLDLGAVLSAWMTADPRCDLNADGLVDSLDIAIVLARWGACP